MKKSLINICAALALSDLSFALDNDFLQQSKTGWLYYPKKTPRGNEITQISEARDDSIKNQPSKQPENKQNAKKPKDKSRIDIKIGKEMSKEEQQLIKDRAFVDRIVHYKGDFREYTGERLKKEFEEAKRIAIDRPTHKNVHAAQILNFALNTRANEFADSWSYNLTMHPNLIRANTAIAGSQYVYKLRTEELEHKNALKKLFASGFKIYYFYDVEREKDLSDDFELMRYTYGKDNVLFFNTANSKALIDALNTRELPSIWAKLRDGELKHIFTGPVFIAEINEGIKKQFKEFFPGNRYHDPKDKYND